MSLNMQSGCQMENRDNIMQQRDISRAQEEAMCFGSLFGWVKPGADPRTYEQASGQADGPRMI